MISADLDMLVKGKKVTFNKISEKKGQFVVISYISGKYTIASGLTNFSQNFKKFFGETVSEDRVCVCVGSHFLTLLSLSC